MNLDYSISQIELTPEKVRTISSGKNYKMALIITNDCYFSFYGEEYHAKTSDMLFLKTRKTATIYPNEYRGCSLLIISISPETIEYFSRPELNMIEKFQYAPFDGGVIHGEAETCMMLINMINKLSKVRNDDFKLGLEMYEENLLSTFLIFFLRACVQSDRVHIQRQQKEFLIDDVFLYIKNHLTEDLSLAKLEGVFYISGEHLSRKFKKSAGMTIHSYILNSRINLSKKYITKGLPISEVYALCGFGSYNHFFKAFKKVCGMTPMEYKNQN